MHPEDIKAAMRKNGVKPSDLARHLGVSQMSVSNTLRGRTKSRRIAEAIAKVVGRPVAEIWPAADAGPSTQERLARLLGDKPAALKQRRAV